MAPPLSSKRPRSAATVPPQLTNNQDAELCCFCRQSLAAVWVVPKSAKRNNRKSLLLSAKERRDTPSSRALCLLHFFTTSAVRFDEVVKQDDAIVETQLQEGVQELFADAYCQLRQELAEEAARAFDRQKKDPLAALLNHPKKKAKPNSHAGGGGFLREVPLPKRIAQQKARLQAQESHNLQRGQTSARKPRRSVHKSIWNLALDPTQKAVPSALATQEGSQDVFCSSCKSTDVTTSGNVTSRNQDMAKGETWGSKDRADEVIIRRQCNECGKTWNEEC